MQIEGEFPEILGIRESLIKHVFEPAALQVSPTECAASTALPPSFLAPSYLQGYSVMLCTA